MRNFKKFLTLALSAVAIVATLCATVSAASTFSDVPATDKNLTQAVSLLSDLNVAKGTTSSTFGVRENVTRQQMAAFLYRLMNKGKNVEGGNNTTKFADLKDSTYFTYVSWANSTGVIKGRTQTSFDPTGKITLQEAYTMIVRALKYDDGTLQYPYDYIDLAESEGLELDKNLNISGQYTKALTRGNVAILLYNAFFAEINEVQINRIEEKVTVDGKTQSYIITEEVKPTLGEKVYDVINEEFQVVATPKFAFNENSQSNTYEPLKGMFDIDSLQLVPVDENSQIQSFYCDFADLNLSGKADDYIMAVMNVYYTVDKDGKVDDVIFASSNKSVLHSNWGTFGKIEAKYVDDYYDGNTNFPKFDGSLVAANVNMYFYNAPYSFVKPVYGSITDEDIRYQLRNSENTQLIELKHVDQEQGTYSYYLSDVKADNPYDLAAALNGVFTGAIFDLEIYDIDGDGKQEYMMYKPYVFGKVVHDEAHVFSEEHTENSPVYIPNEDSHILAINEVPVIYTYGADITGVEVHDGEFVFAYLNPAANQIDFNAIAKVMQGTISNIDINNAVVYVNGKSYRTCYQYLTVKNYHVTYPDDDTSPTKASNTSQTQYLKDLLTATAIDSEFVFYTFAKRYDCIYFYEPVSSKGATYSEDNLLVPVDCEENREVKAEFDGTTGKAIYYLKVWNGEKETYVPVDMDELNPKPTRYKDTYDFGVEIVETDSKSYPAYLGRICSYEVGPDGKYIITPLLHAYNEEGDYVGVAKDANSLVEEDNTELFGRDLYFESEAQIKKITNSRYELIDPLGYSLLGDEAVEYLNYFVMKDDTKIIIKNNITGTEEVEYLEFDKDSFGGTTSEDSYLYNVQYILKGDPDSRVRADLVLLYAEADDFEFETKESSSDWRIIKDYTPGTDDKDNYRYYYDLYNVFTGKVEENVPGSKSYSAASSLNYTFDAVAGQIVKLTTTGAVDETKTEYDNIDAVSNTNLVFIEDYAANDGILEIVPVNEEDGVNFISDNAGRYLYQVTDETAVAVLTSDKIDNFAKAEIKALTKADLASAKKEFKCYNDKLVKEGKDTFYTEYAKNIKCYLAFTEAEAEDELPTADYIVIVVHPDEAEEYLDI